VEARAWLCRHLLPAVVHQALPQVPAAVLLLLWGVSDSSFFLRSIRRGAHHGLARRTASLQEGLRASHWSLEHLQQAGSRDISTSGSKDSYWQLGSGGAQTGIAPKSPVLPSPLK